jgi:GTPase-activating protein BEM2
MKKLLRMKDKDKDKNGTSSSASSRAGTSGKHGKSSRKQPHSSGMQPASHSTMHLRSSMDQQRMPLSASDYAETTPKIPLYESSSSIHESVMSSSSSSSELELASSSPSSSQPHVNNGGTGRIANIQDVRTRSSSINDQNDVPGVDVDNSKNDTNGDANADDHGNVFFEDTTVVSNADDSLDNSTDNDTFNEGFVQLHSSQSRSHRPPSILPMAHHDGSSDHLPSPTGVSFSSPTPMANTSSATNYVNRFAERKNSLASYISTSTNISNVTTSNSSELKKMITSDFRKLGRNVMPKSSRHEQHSLSMNSINTPNRDRSNIASLVKPDWDNSLLKTSWINKLAEHDEFRLYRLELKGSNLLLHKTYQDMNFAKNLQIEDKSSQSMATHASDISSYMSNDVNSIVTANFNATTLKTPVEETHEAAHPQISKDLNPIPAEKRLEVVQGSSDVTQTETDPHKSEILSLSEAIDQMQNLKLELAAESVLEKEDSTSNAIIENYKPLKHLPFIIHELYYQSPSCPHPKLTFDTTSGMIMRGTLEAICHTILFYPSERMAERLIEILPMVSSLIDSLVYFQKYLDHFTDVELLRKKGIKVSDMEMNILFTRLKKIVEITLLQFKGCILDDEIFKLLKQLLQTLIEKSGTHLNEDDLLRLQSKLIEHRKYFISLVSFQLVKTDGSADGNVDSIDVDTASLLSGEDFIMSSTDSLAQEVQAIDLHFLKHWSPRDDKSMIFSTLENIESSYHYWKYNPLQFIPSIHTHYLGRLLSYHLFEDPTSSKTAESRSRVLMKWIHLGTSLYERGDMVAWLGIAVVMCSLPVLRLSETWSLVDVDHLNEIKKKWAPVVFEVRKNEYFNSKSSDDKSKSSNPGAQHHEIEHTDAEKNVRIMIANNAGISYAKENAVPYFGELFTSDPSTLRTAVFEKNGFETSSMGTGESTKDIFRTDFIKSYCSYLELVEWNLKQWDAYCENVVNAPGVKSRFSKMKKNNVSDDTEQGSYADDKSNGDFVINGCRDAKLSAALKTAIAYNSSYGLFSTNQLMCMSITTEPPYVGKFAKFHGVSRSPLFLGSYASILFPQVLPYYEIYDQAELIGAIGGGKLMDTDMSKKYRNRNVFLKHVRDLFDAGSEEFNLLDGSIIFKTSQPVAISKTKTDEIDETKNVTVSALSSPPTALFENPAKAKHLSTVSTGSFNLDDYITSYQSYLKDSIRTDTTAAGLSMPQSPVLTNYVEKVDIVTNAASPDRLVDLLVLTTSAFGMHIQEDDLKRYSKKTSITNPLSLQMDDIGFTCTFFATYRVFLTTKQLIDALHRRFVGSKSAAMSIVHFAEHVSKNGQTADEKHTFPRWDDTVGEDSSTWSSINWKFVGQIQLGVMEAILALVNGYFKHFMDDLDTKCSFDTLLELLDATIVSEWPAIIKWLKENSSDDTVLGVIEVYKTLQTTYKQVRNICIRKSYTPQLSSKGLKFSNELSTIPLNFCLPESTDIDQINLFVSQMDETIGSAMKLITPDDWIDTFEILQMLISRSPLAMFNYEYQSSDTHKDLVRVSNIYHWLMTLSDNDSMDSTEKLIEKLPVSIKSMFQLYERFMTYFLMQIVDDKITFDMRIDKMSTLLKIIQVARVRMQDVKLFEESLNTKASKSTSNSPYIPSFLESVIVNTIMLPESRFFSHAWKSAISIYHDAEFDDHILDSLEIVLPQLSEYELGVIKLSPACSLCPGWIVKRLVEIACFVPNMDVDNTELINFGKNRYIHNCILKIHSLQTKLVRSEISPYLSSFSFLFEFEGILPPTKRIYELAVGEQQEQKLPFVSIFTEHIDAQTRLIKLEESKRDLLMKQHDKKNDNPYNLTLATNDAHVDADIASLSTTVTKESGYAHDSSASLHEFNAKSITTPSNHSIYDGASSTVVNSSIDTGSSALSVNPPPFKSSKVPISSGTSSSAPKTGKSNSRSQSKFQPHGSALPSPGSNKFKFGFFKSRPFSLTMNNLHQTPAERKSVNLMDIPIAEQVTNKGKPTQSIVLKDVSIFPTYRTPNSFTIDTSTSNANSGNQEYTFQTVTEDEASEWIYQLTYAKKHWFNSKVLNKHFSNSCAKLTFGAPLSFVCERDGASTPMIIEKILSEIELRGIEEVGIYRKSASLIVVQQIKDEVNKTGDFNMENSLVFDIHNLTGCIKAYLRELPEPLIPDIYIDQISKVREFAQSESRFDLYRQILSKLPTYNYSMIERLSRHMKLIEEYKSQNKMTSYNLATIMGGSFVEGCRPETMRQSFGVMNFICEDWILHYDEVFY